MLRSLVVPTAFVSGFQKLGQPVPLSNLVAEEKSGSSQPAQAKVPLRCSWSSGLVTARSVPAWRRSRILRRSEPLAPFGVGQVELEGLGLGREGPMPQ